MYSAHSLLRPWLSVIYPYTAHHLVLFKSPGNATPPRQFSAEAANNLAHKPIIFCSKWGSQQMLPKGNVVKGGISWKTHASGAHWGGDSLQKRYKHPTAATNIQRTQKAGMLTQAKLWWRG